MTDFVDSNVIVYAHDAAEPAKREQALAVLSADNWMVSAQVLSEFFVTVTRKLAVPMSWHDASAAIDDLSARPVVPISSGMVARAVELAHANQVSYWDGLILAAAAEAGCERVVTADLNSAQTITGIAIHNPFG